MQQHHDHAYQAMPLQPDSAALLWPYHECRRSLHPLVILDQQMPHRWVKKCSILAPWYADQLQLWPGPDPDTSRRLLEPVHSPARPIEREGGRSWELRPFPIWIRWTKESEFNLLHELCPTAALQRPVVPILALSSQWWKGVRLARRCTRQASRQQLTSLVGEVVLILTNDR